MEATSRVLNINDKKSGENGGNAGISAELLSTLHESIKIQREEQLKARIKEELKEKWEDRYETLKDRYESKIDDLKDKNESLTRELSELRNDLHTTMRTHFSEIDKIKEEKAAEIADLKNQLHEKAIKIAVIESGGENKKSIAETLVEKFGDSIPELLSSITAAANQAQSAQQTIPQQAGQPYYEQPQAQQNPGNPGEQPSTQDQTEMTSEQFIDDFFTNMLNLGKQKMQEQDPDLDQLVGYVHNNLEWLTSNGAKPEADHWLDAANNLATFAIEENIPAKKVAAVLMPVLEQIVTSTAAKMALKAFPASEVTDMLFKMYDIKADAKVKKLITSVIEEFKNSKKG